MKKTVSILLTALMLFSANCAFAEPYYISWASPTLRYDADAKSPISTGTLEDGTAVTYIAGDANGGLLSSGFSRFFGTGFNNSRPKNNFDYTFDFRADEGHKQAAFYIGDKDYVEFRKYGNDETTYYISVNGTIAIPAAGQVYQEGTRLDLGKWYTIRICIYTHETPGQFYVSVTDSETGEMKGEYLTNLLLGYSIDQLVDNTLDRYYRLYWKTYSVSNLMMKDEKLITEKFFAFEPELEITESGVALKETVYNTYVDNGVAPKLEIAVYNSDMLMVGYKEKSDTEAPRINGTQLTETNNELSYDLTDLSDGIYTVKAYVTDSMGTDMPYHQSVAKTIRISEGIVTEVTQQ